MRLLRFIIVAGYLVAVAALLAISLDLVLTLMSTAAKLHVAAKVGSVKSEASYFGSSTVTVQYRSSSGREVTRSFEEKMHLVPSVGDSVTLLIGPFGAMEANPFPAMWLVVAVLYAFFCWMIWFLTWCRTRLSSSVPRVPTS